MATDARKRAKLIVHAEANRFRLRTCSKRQRGERIGLFRSALAVRAIKPARCDTISISIAAAARIFDKAAAHSPFREGRRGIATVYVGVPGVAFIHAST